jgi:hypothetical protein
MWSISCPPGGIRGWRPIAAHGTVRAHAHDEAHQRFGPRVVAKEFITLRVEAGGEISTRPASSAPHATQSWRKFGGVERL